MAFVCVNYNGCQSTLGFLKSIENLDSGSDCEKKTVVVDNASQSADVLELRKCISDFEGAELLEPNKNLGYFGGLNFGLSRLELSRFDYVVVGNNDLEFASDFLTCLKAARYDPDVLVVAPNVITADGYNQNPHCVEKVSSVRKLLYRLYFSSYWLARLMVRTSRVIARMRGGRRNLMASSSRVIHMGIGACYVLPREFFARCSRLDDSVFLYGEEALLAGQVAAAGGCTFYDSTLCVMHAESATLSKIPSRATYEFAKASYPRYRDFL